MTPGLDKPKAYIYLTGIILPDRLSLRKNYLLPKKLLTLNDQRSLNPDEEDY
jgi:hypothetical protein